MPFNQKKFLRSIQGANTSDSSSDDEGFVNLNNNKSQRQTQQQQTKNRRRQRSQTKNNHNNQQKTKILSSSSSSDSDSSSSDHQKQSTVQKNPKLSFIQQKYSKVEWRAGTIFDCFSGNFYHFTQFFNNCLGPRIASATQKDKTKRPPDSLIRKCTQLLLDFSTKKNDDNVVLPIFFTCRNTADEVEFSSLNSRGVYLFETEQSQDLIERASKILLLSSNTSNVDSVETLNNNRNNSNNKTKYSSPVWTIPQKSNNTQRTIQQQQQQQQKIQQNEETTNNNVGIDPSSLFIHRLLPHNFSVKTNLKSHSLDFPTTADGILSSGVIVPPWWITIIDRQNNEEEDTQQQRQQLLVGSKHHHKELIEKRGPQCFSVATVFWEAPPVLIEKSHQKRVFSICGGKVVINQSQNNIHEQSSSSSSFFPPEIGSVFLSASLPDELLILNSRWEANRSYQLFKIPSSLHTTTTNFGGGGGSVEGHKSEFRRTFQQGLTEPLHHFVVSNCLYLVGRRTIKSTKKRQQQNDENSNHNNNNVFRTASDIMCVAPGSLNVEHDAGILVGLRDGTCALYDAPQQRNEHHHHRHRKQFHVFGKVDNDPIVSIGVCDLFSSSLHNNNNDNILQHVYTVTASQRLILWDLNNNNNGDSKQKLVEDEKKEDYNNNNNTLEKNECFLMILNNEAGNPQQQHEGPVPVSNLMMAGGTVLSGVSRFSFVPGQRCFFEYDFVNDAVYLKRISRSLITNSWFVEIVARWEQLSGGDANAHTSSENLESDFVILNNNNTNKRKNNEDDVVVFSDGHHHQRQQQQLQQTIQDHKNRQRFSQFNPQPFYGSVTAGVDFETKRPCCFIVDEVHQFAAAVMY